MMQQAVMGLALARRMNAPLLVDWRHCFYSDPATGANVFGNHVFHPDMQPVEAAATLSFSLDAATMLAAGNYPNPTSEHCYDALIQGTAALQPRWLVFSEALPGFDRRLHSPALARFSFGEAIERDANDFIRAHGLDGAVGVHYRHGNGEFADIKSDDRIAGEIRHICRMIGDAERRMPARAVFVATDSTIAEAQFREYLHGFRVVVLPKSFQPPGSGAMHYSAIAADSASQAVHLSLRPTLTEMVVLSRCARIYRARQGSFTNWATARLLCVYGRDPSDIVEYPFFRRPAKVLRAQSVLTSARRAKRAIQAR
jgi:Nodulation protein Z (NodZ)